MRKDGQKVSSLSTTIRDNNFVLHLMYNKSLKRSIICALNEMQKFKMDLSDLSEPDQEPPFLTSWRTHMDQGMTLGKSSSSTVPSSETKQMRRQELWTKRGLKPVQKPGSGLDQGSDGSNNSEKFTRGFTVTSAAFKGRVFSRDMGAFFTETIKNTFCSQSKEMGTVLDQPACNPELSPSKKLKM